MSKTAAIIERLTADPSLSAVALARELGCTPAMVSYTRRNKLGQAAMRPGPKPSTFASTGEAHGLPTWSHGWLKTEQASIFFRNDAGDMSYEDVRDELVADLKRHAPKYPTLKRDKIREPHCLVVDPADVHIGKLASASECGQGYTVEDAIKRVEDGIDALLAKAQGFPVEKVVLVIGNDVLHVDGPRNETTNGTRQDVSGVWHENFVAARKLYVRVIERLTALADVHVVYCPSNHDRASGFMLADAVACWFARAKNVTFDASIAHRKYLLYGQNLLAFDHGDGAKDGDAKDLMADEVPQLWAATRYRYAYKHHLHHKRRGITPSGRDHIGLTVEYVRSPSPADSWHAKQGYRAPQAVEAFIHSKDRGQVARLTHYFS